MAGGGAVRNPGLPCCLGGALLRVPLCWWPALGWAGALDLAGACCVQPIQPDALPWLVARRCATWGCRAAWAVRCCACCLGCYIAHWPMGLDAWHSVL